MEFAFNESFLHQFDDNFLESCGVVVREQQIIKAESIRHYNKKIVVETEVLTVCSEILKKGKLNQRVTCEIYREI